MLIVEMNKAVNGHLLPYYSIRIIFTGRGLRA